MRGKMEGKKKKSDNLVYSPFSKHFDWFSFQHIVEKALETRKAILTLRCPPPPSSSYDRSL